jgi:spermidine/putrescine-binding protein
LALGWRPTPALRVLATARFVASPLFTNFTRASGLPVELALADEPDTLTGFEAAIIPAYTLTRFIQHGALRELTSIPAPAQSEQRVYDPVNVYSRPAGRGGIGINARGRTPPASWAEFFELARIVPTHLPLAESIRAALKMLGESINTRDARAWDAARALVSDLVSTPPAQAQLALSAQRPGWEFVIPAAGSEQWEDVFCIPTQSAQPDLAQALIQWAITTYPLSPLPVAPLEPRSPFAPVFG